MPIRLSSISKENNRSIMTLKQDQVLPEDIDEIIKALYKDTTKKLKNKLNY